MDNYGYAQSNQMQGNAVRTTTEADNIVNRLSERLEGIRIIAKRLDDLSNRLAGPRPRELPKETGNASPAAVPPFAHRLNNVDAHMERAISECQSALNALESFV